MGRLALRALMVGLACYVATKVAFVLCLRDSKVSLVFPPYAVLVAILLFVPVGQWWACVVAATVGHRLAAWQSDWPFWYSLHCEAFDAVKYVSAAAGIRLLTRRAPLRFETLREAVPLIGVAALVVPFATAFWGAAFTVSNGYGTDYWVEWRNLGLSNAVTAIALLPGIILLVANKGRGPADWRRLPEAVLLAAGLVATGLFVFGRPGGLGADTWPALLYAPVPMLVWAAIRFGPGGTGAALLLVWVLAIWEAMHGRGPFLTHSPTENTLSLQFFFLLNAVPLMLLAVVVREARNSQSELRENEARFRAMTNTAPVMIWKSGPDMGCTFFNDGWLDFTGRTLAQERGDGWAEGVHPEDRARVLRVYVTAFEARRDFTIEYRLRRHDTEFRWILNSGVPRFGPDGTFQGYIGSCVDVTARKRADLELQWHRTELAHLSRVTTMGELSGSMAHELKQPLTAIMTNAQAALRFIARDAADLVELRAILLDIIADDRRAADVIGRLRLLFTKGEVQFQPLVLNEVIADVTKLLHSDLIHHKVVIDQDLAAGLPTVSGDRVQLQQVLINLIVNGCDAMADARSSDRRLSVRTRREDDDAVSVSVSDRGCGIAGDRLEAVFEPFVTTKPSGLGLGLAVCRTIVTAHGGRVRAENNPDAGASFVVTLPTVMTTRDVE